ncbi:MAG: hypothetical protein IJ845_03085 [Bacteroidaceae bacterium]|nr:hypothetical protein [Bacteroidaceae bacterium]
MTTSELNIDILRSLGVIAEDEGLLSRAAKYLRRLAQSHEAEDPTLMTKEEFVARVKAAKEEGDAMRFDSVEELDKYIRSL